MNRSRLPEVLVLDGGLATELQRRGCDVGGALWSARALLDCPDAVEAVHLDYLLAGADCVTTASYQVSFEGFAEAGLSATDTIRALETSVAVAQAARQSTARNGTQGLDRWLAGALWGNPSQWL